MVEHFDTSDTTDTNPDGQLVQIAAEAVQLTGLLHVPDNAHGMVILAHGIDDVEQLTHNVALSIAQALYGEGLATLVVDLFTTEEQQLDAETLYFRANTSIMEQRIVGVAEWLLQTPTTQHLAIGYFGMGATGSSTLIAAAERPDVVAAIVSVGGQLAEAQEYLPRILSPTLLIALGNDPNMIAMNQATLEKIAVEKHFEQVANLGKDLTRVAGAWFTKYLTLIGE
jgi:dienelactone hydrolase